MNFSLVKEKESYKVYNNTNNAGYYTITKTGCSLQEEPVQSGNFSQLEPISFTPKGDGDYVVSLNTGTVVTEGELLPEEVVGDEQFTISHYPLLIKSVIDDLEKLLCDNCGCSSNGTSCTSKEGKACLESQLVLGNITFLMGVIKTLNCNNTNVNVLHNAASHAIRTYKCEMMQLFCSTLTELKIRGDYEYDGVLLKKVLSIYYLMLYFYEKEITNKEQEYITFLNDKYNFKTLKACILKSEIDVSLVENLFTEVYYEACSEPDILCDLSCFKPVNAPVDKLFEFDINEELNGIYDTVTMKNTCGNNQLFMNRVLYKDDSFKVLLKVQSSTNPTDIAPGEEFLVNIVFQGTKSEYTLINLPFRFEGTLVNTYQIRFSESVVVTNTPPVITPITKTLNDRNPYTFTIADFENNFTDADGDTLDKIVLVGDVSNFKFDGLPYVSGTVITRNNITKLVYQPLSGTSFYEIVLHWKAYDSRGLESN